MFLTSLLALVKKIFMEKHVKWTTVCGAVCDPPDIESLTDNPVEILKTICTCMYAFNLEQETHLRWTRVHR